MNEKWWNRKVTIIFAINCSSTNRKRNWWLDSGIRVLHWAKMTKIVGNDSGIDGKWWTQRSSRRLSLHFTFFQNIVRRRRKIKERFGVRDNCDCKAVTFYGNWGYRIHSSLWNLLLSTQVGNREYIVFFYFLFFKKINVNNLTSDSYLCSYILLTIISINRGTICYIINVNFLKK